MKKIMILSLPLVLAALFSGCALGAASAVTAGYSLKSQSADSLTVEAEQRIVDRVKREVKAEIHNMESCASKN